MDTFPRQQARTRRFTLGERLAPDYADVRHSKLVVIWGHNPASTAPHFVPFLREAGYRG